MIALGRIKRLAAVLSLAVPLCAAQTSPPAPQAFLVAGKVVNAITGAPLERPQVSLSDVRMPARRMQLITGEDGKFSFPGIPAGKYSLHGVKGGYLSAGFEQHEQYATAIVTGADYATDNLVLRLLPTAMISGYVLDEAGEGVRQARVLLYLEAHIGGLVRVITRQASAADDRGYFDFNLLEPGTYFLSVVAKPWYAIHPATLGMKKDAMPKVPAALDVAYPLTFYGGGTDAESAEPIALKAGEKLDLTIHLAPVPALHLMMSFPSDGSQEVMALPMFQKPVFDTMTPPLRPEIQPSATPGAIEITGIAPGMYEVKVPGANGNAGQSLGQLDLQQNGQSLSPRGEQLGKLKITVKMRAEGAMPPDYALALLDARMRAVSFNNGDPGGTVTINDIKPGSYALEMIAQGRAFSVEKTISAAGESAGHMVNVGGSAPLEVTAEIVEGTGRVDGVVLKDGKATSGVMVVLVPKDLSSQQDLVRRDQSDMDGTFTLRGVVPGDYTVVAVEDAWGMDWGKAGALEKYAEKGKSVTASPGTVRIGPVEAQPK